MSIFSNILNPARLHDLRHGAADQQPVESAVNTKDSPLKGAASEAAGAQTSSAGMLSRAFGGLATVVQGANEAFHWLAGGSESLLTDGPPPTISARPEPKLSLYQQNVAQAEQLLNEINTHLRVLDVQLATMDGRHQPVMTGPRSGPAPEMTWNNTFDRWRYQTQGAATATTSAMGWGTIAAALPYAAGLFTQNLLAYAGALLGGGYLAATTLRDLPTQQAQNAADRAIRETMQTIKPLQIRLDKILAEEKDREQAMNRVITVAAERKRYIQQLDNKLRAIDVALNRDPSLATTAAAAPQADDASMRIGSGAQRQQSLSLLGRTQAAFQSLLPGGDNPNSVITHSLTTFGNAVGYGLSGIRQAVQSTVAIPANLADRYTTYRAELAYQKGEGKSMMDVLRTAPEKGQSIVDNSFRQSIKDYQNVRGYAPSITEVRTQLHIGENIAHSLGKSSTPTPGSVVFQTKDARVAVPSNLTTVRALAWYFDAAASIDEPQKDASAPAVRRDGDSLVIADPHGNIYDFLMQAPTAYTVNMVSAGEGNDADKIGVFRLHDYYAGFPRGKKGVEFTHERDTAGNSVVRMRMIDEPATYGIRPTAFALLDDAHLAHDVLKTVNQDNLSSLAVDYYMKMSKDDLIAAKALAVAEIERQIAFTEVEQKRLVQLENWQNPHYQDLFAKP